MDDTEIFFDSQSTFEYVEMQNSGTYSEEYEETPLIEIFSALIFPFLILVLVYFLVIRRAAKQTNLAVTTATENTKAIAENNELLRENIALQREILEAMRKSNAERES